MSRLCLAMVEDKPQGIILYKGPSRINGKPIVSIATGLQHKSTNTKTGDLVQTYILVERTNPIDALEKGLDEAICGDCIHRKVDGAGSCYVELSHGPRAVYSAYKRGNYKEASPEVARKLMDGRIVRLGTYGDPVAVPLDIWKNILKDAKGWTGYTHQWRKAFAKGFNEVCMASVETKKGAEFARSKGWRTYRIRHSTDDPLMDGEFECPASNEQNYRLTCEQCRACNGGNPKKVSPAIIVHGTGWKTNRFKEVLKKMDNKEKYRGIYNK